MGSSLLIDHPELKVFHFLEKAALVLESGFGKELLQELVIRLARGFLIFSEKIGINDRLKRCRDGSKKELLESIRCVVKHTHCSGFKNSEIMPGIGVHRYSFELLLSGFGF